MRENRKENAWMATKAKASEGAGKTRNHWILQCILHIIVRTKNTIKQCCMWRNELNRKNNWRMRIYCGYNEYKSLPSGHCHCHIFTCTLDPSIRWENDYQALRTYVFTPQLFHMYFNARFNLSIKQRKMEKKPPKKKSREKNHCYTDKQSFIVVHIHSSDMYENKCAIIIFPFNVWFVVVVPR